MATYRALKGVRMDFYAKSNPKQTLEEHTEEALQQYRKIKAYRTDLLESMEWEILKWAVCYHDFGKLDTKFQNQIRRSIKEDLIVEENESDMIPHNFMSFWCVSEALKEKLKVDKQYKSAEIFCGAIYYHHDRKEKRDKGYLPLYFEQNIYPNLRQFALQNQLSFPYTLPSKVFDWGTYYVPQKLKKILDNQADPDVLRRYTLIKGLLNRIDYAASAGSVIEQITDQSIGTQVQKFMHHKAYPLRPVQEFMNQHQEDNVVVVAATGSGKTEAALLWIGSEKGFYTLPLKVSINDIFRRIKDNDGIDYEAVALLHSDALSYYLGEEKNHSAPSKQGADIKSLQKYTISRQFAAPLTICTIDQLFRFVYKCNGGEISLATLAYSKLIIDEIQSYSPRLIAIILYGLKLICQMGGKFAIVTATFPPFLYEIMEELEIPYKTNPKHIPFYGEVQQRHRISFLPGKSFPLEEICHQGQLQKVLVIVNTVKAAQDLYCALLDQKANVRLLHSMFLQKHRKQIEADIMAFARNGNQNKATGIWISTQIVEASLDLDFDLLYTEMCPVDQLLQRMGRCYRSRNYTKETANVYVLNNRNGVSATETAIIAKDIYDLSLQALSQTICKANDLDWDDEACLPGKMEKMEYIVEDLAKKKKTALLYERDTCDLKQAMICYVFKDHMEDRFKKTEYYNKICQTLETLKNLTYYSLEMKDVEIQFRDINSKTFLPRSIYKQNEADIKQHIARLKSKIPANKKREECWKEKQHSKDEIQKYTVNVSFYYGLDYDMQELYPFSSVYLYNGDYEFDEDTKVGRGLIKKYAAKNTSNQPRIEELFI